MKIFSSCRNETHLCILQFSKSTRVPVYPSQIYLLKFGRLPDFCYLCSKNRKELWEGWARMWESA